MLVNFQGNKWETEILTFTCFSFETLWTVAHVVIHQFKADARVLAWIWGALVDLCW